MFSLSAPTGELKNFTAVVPVVNCCANVGTVIQYSKHANRSICMKMWPFIVCGQLLRERRYGHTVLETCEQEYL